MEMYQDFKETITSRKTSVNLDLNIYDFLKAFLKWFVSIYNIIYFSNVSLFFFFFQIADSTALLSLRVFISTASLLPACSMSCGKTAPLRPLNAFIKRTRANGEETLLTYQTEEVRQQPSSVRFKRTVRCQFPSVQNYCFLARTKSQHIFLICSVLNWKRKFFVFFAGGRAELRSGWSELRGQVMDIYQEALDYLQSHHVAGETNRHQISM